MFYLSVSKGVGSSRIRARSPTRNITDRGLHILIDPPENNTMWELAELAQTNDKELWRLNTNVPACKQNPMPAREALTFKIRILAGRD